jgi:uncharacterized protein (TIGR02145 family)
VRIGSLTASRPGIGLDLNGDGNTATTGLGLPVVELTATNNPNPLGSSFDNLQGVAVYNKTEGNGLEKGLYFVNEGKWVRVLEDFVITSSFPEAVCLNPSSTPTALTVTTSIDAAKDVTLSYQWYYLNGSETAPQLITGATNATFSIARGTASHQLSMGNIKNYYCVVSDGSKSTETNRVRAFYSGVYTNSGKTTWLYMLPYNLGVTEEGKSMTPAQQEAAAASLSGSNDVPSITGSRFQWGRIADGHELYGSPIYSDASTTTNGVSVNSAGQVTDSNIKGKFILRNTGTNDWRNHTATKWDTASDPCSSVKDGGKTWRLPTSAEWQLIYNYNSPQYVSNRGVRIRPDGSNTSFFLPATGARVRTNGGMSAVGVYGHYWSSTPDGTNALLFGFGYNNEIFPTDGNNRSYAFSVRCVAE